MTTSNPMATALLTEHFRYTPLTLLDDIINTVNELVFRAVNAIEEGLSDASPASLGFTLPIAATDRTTPPINDDASSAAALQSAKDREIAAGVVALESLLNATVDRDFDKFELYALRNILAVGRDEEGLAPWVRLEHYRAVPLPNSSTSSSDHSTTAPPIDPAQLQLARRKLHETAKLDALLRAEEARNEAVLAQLRNLLGATATTTGEEPGTQEGAAAGDDGAPLAFLRDGARGGPLRLTQAAGDAARQVPALRELLGQLRGALAALPEARKGLVAGAGEEDVAGQRQQYVEARARRAVEMRGLEAEDEAAVAGAAMGRRRVGREDLLGLEAVARAIGGGSAPGERRVGDDDMDEGE